MLSRVFTFSLDISDDATDLRHVYLVIVTATGRLDSPAGRWAGAVAPLYCCTVTVLWLYCGCTMAHPPMSHTVAAAQFTL